MWILFQGGQWDNSANLKRNHLAQMLYFGGKHAAPVLARPSWKRCSQGSAAVWAENPTEETKEPERRWRLSDSEKISGRSRSRDTKMSVKSCSPIREQLFVTEGWKSIFFHMQHSESEVISFSDAAAHEQLLFNKRARPCCRNMDRCVIRMSESEPGSVR